MMTFRDRARNFARTNLPKPQPRPPRMENRHFRTLGFTRGELNPNFDPAALAEFEKEKAAYDERIKQQVAQLTSKEPMAKKKGGSIKRKKMHKMPDGSMMRGASHKGGKKKYGHGGKIDGCATRGKTRGRMV